MKLRIRHTLSVLLVLVTALVFSGCTQLLQPAREMTAPSSTGPVRTLTRATIPTTTADKTRAEGLGAVKVEKNGRYTSKMEVAAYLYQFKELPPNYLTKAQARERGWQAEKGNLWQVTDQMSIGGDRFGNFEGLLPEKAGRQYYECDIDYRGGSRGARRIVYSNDGLIFYTDDHYESFERLN